ncbi:MAG: hypothetical protein DMG79_04825 [Acidobacteria bacterium]|nr:MAG: hypothetical protein DMG79_04825 [Acidobacteriota bacterium]
MLMRAIVLRVSRAQVNIGNEVVGEIGPGLLVFLVVANSDTQADPELPGGKLYRPTHLRRRNGKSVS